MTWRYKMLTITDGGSLARALKLTIDLRLKQLLIERRDQLGGDISHLALCEEVLVHHEPQTLGQFVDAVAQVAELLALEQ